MFAPLIQPARSESRNVTTSATSSELPNRPQGNSRRSNSAKRSGFAARKRSQPPPGNMIDPGLTVFTRIRCGASSQASALDRKISAAFAAPYAPAAQASNRRSRR